jgi:hypothetical protein
VSEADTIGKKVVDSIAGVPAFIARLAALRYMFPEFPEYMIWEIDSQSQGGKPGEGALMQVTFGALNKIPAATLPGKTAKLAAESSLLAGITAAGGGDTTEILTSAAIPIGFKSINAAKSAYRQLSAIKPPKTSGYKTTIEALSELQKLEKAGKEIPENLKQFKAQVDEIVKPVRAMAEAEMAVVDPVIPTPLKSDGLASQIYTKVASQIERKTGLFPYIQPNGKFTILDSANLHELKTNVPADKVGREIQRLLLTETPETVASPYRRKGNSMTIDDRVVLKQNLNRLEVVSNAAYKEGKAAGIQSEQGKIQALKDKMLAFKTQQGVKEDRMILAREIITDTLPKAEQGPFLANLLKAQTEGGFDKLIGQMEGYIQRREISNSVKMMRETYRELLSRYGDRTGKPFAKAPENLRPILEKIYNGVNVKNIREPLLEGDMAGLSDDVAKLVGNLRDAVGALNAKSKTAAELGESFFAIPEAVADGLNDIASRPTGKLTPHDVNFLNYVTRMVVRRSDMAHTIKVGEKEYALGEISKELLSGVRQRDVMPGDIKTGLAGETKNLKKFLTTEQEQLPTLLFKMFGDNKTTRQMLRDLWDAENKALEIEQTSFQIVRDYLKQKNVDLDNVIKSLDKPIEVSIGGQKVTMQRGELLSLAMMTRDPYVFDQLMQTKGLEIRGNRYSKQTIDEMGEAFAKLTADEMTYGSAFFHLNNTFLKHLVNKTSMALDNEIIATDPRYFPISRATGLRTSANFFAPKSIEDEGYFLPRIGGKAYIKVKDYTNTLVDFVQVMSQYGGMAETLRSWKGIFADANMQDRLIKAGYRDELAATIKLMNRAEKTFTDTSMMEQYGSKILNRFAKAQLSARTSTVAVQFAAIPAAFSEIDMKYFRPQDVLTSQAAAEILDRSAFFYNRWYGGKINIEVGNVAASESIQRNLLLKRPATDIAMEGIVWADKKSIGIIYNAAKRMMAEQGLSGDKLIDAAVAKTEEVIRLTQQTWSPYGRSNFTSDPGTFRKTLAMFRSAQEAQYNILLRANEKYQRSQKTSADKAELAKQYGAVGSAVVSAILLRNAARTGRLAAIAGAAQINGDYVPQDDKDIEENIVKMTVDAAKEASDMIPGMRALINLTENAVYTALGEQKQVYSLDPINSTYEVTVDAAKVFGKWAGVLIDAASDKGVNRYGLTVESDKLPDNLVQEITADFGKVLKAASTVTGIPGSAVADEWILPASKKSKHPMVEMIRLNDSDNAINLQRKLDRFLTEFGELESKESKQGLTSSEKDKYWRMKPIKITIDAFNELLHARKKYEMDTADYTLSPLEARLNEYYGNNE